MKITVHSFRHYNGTTDSYEYPESKRTADDIERLNRESTAALEILPNTAEVIDISQLDDRGRYFPSR